MNLMILIFSMLAATLSGQQIHFTECSLYADDSSYIAPSTDMPNACIGENGELSIAFDE